MKRETSIMERGEEADRQTDRQSRAEVNGALERLREGDRYPQRHQKVINLTKGEGEVTPLPPACHTTQPARQSG